MLNETLLDILNNYICKMEIVLRKQRVTQAMINKMEAKKKSVYFEFRIIISSKKSLFLFRMYMLMNFPGAE